MFVFRLSDKENFRMPVVTMEGIGQTTCEDGRRLVLAIMDSGVDILHRCGGNARCATCRVRVIDGEPSPVTDAERVRLAALQDQREGIRLSCQIQVRNDLTVEIVRRLKNNPDMADAGPQPIEWPADHPLPPEE
jgi:ferredoxin